MFGLGSYVANFTNEYAIQSDNLIKGGTTVFSFEQNIIMHSHGYPNHISAWWLHETSVQIILIILMFLIVVVICTLLTILWLYYTYSLFTLVQTS